MDTKEKDQLLENLFKDNPGAEVPQDVDTRLRHHLVTLRKRMEEPKGEKRTTRVTGWGLTLRYATPAIAIIFIGFLGFLVLSGGDASRAYADAYADVVKQIRNASSLTYTMTNQVETLSRGIITIKQECVFKEPHYIRCSDPDGNYVVQNMAEHKDLVVLPHKKWYTLTDYYNVPSEESPVPGIIDEFRSLPKRADEILGEQEIGGHTVRGFRVKIGVIDKTLWIDTETGDLVRMEKEYVTAPGSRMVFDNIRFDIKYDDSFFSLEPPTGFTPVNVAFDASKPNEQDLINTLDFFTSHQVDGLFPESLNQNKLSVYLEDLNNMKSGELRGPDMEGMTEEEKQKIRIDISWKLSRGFDFAMLLEPQKWYYAGKGVKRGAANTPVFWYKPDRSKTYRVIYADLTVRDVAPKDLPSLPPLPTVQKN